MQAIQRPGRLYLPQLDVMRFFAFLAVFWSHSLPGVDQSHAGFGGIIARLEGVSEQFGFNGVGLFFLLSAYLITKLLLAERETTGGIHLKQFYVRRMLRIWPLYYLI